MAHLKGNKQVQGFLELSNYDPNVFYMMTNTSPIIEWIKKKIYVWRKEHKCMAKIDFNNLNITYDYNYNMKNVDIADKSIFSYRFDHCLLKIKFWWSIFLVL